MQGDDFEERLRRQPLRKLPDEWRNDILSAANATAESGQSCRTARSRMSLSTLNARLAMLLWPSPKAWAGLAGIWLLLLAVNQATRNNPMDLTNSEPQSASAMIMAWKEQQRVLAELMQPAKTASIQPTKQGTVSPRSERSQTFRVV